MCIQRTVADRRDGAGVLNRGVLNQVIDEEEKQH